MPPAPKKETATTAMKEVKLSSTRARDAYVEAFDDFKRPGFDTEKKAQSLPPEIRSSYLEGLAAAKQGWKLVRKGTTTRS
jgi:hypothetical protein